jgi:hypothetical protein
MAKIFFIELAEERVTKNLSMQQTTMSVPSSSQSKARLE